MHMEETVSGSAGTLLPAEEAAEYVEFKRTKREAEILLTLKKIIVDASRRETDGVLLKKACEFARRAHASGILLSPVNVPPARRLLHGDVKIVCLVGGTGETLPAVKKTEAKRCMRAGAAEIRLVPCYSALIGGNLTYLKREIAKVRRAVRGCSVILSLEDHTLGEDEIALGVRAAAEGGASGVCVRGETPLLLRAEEAASGKLFVDCSGVENAEQLRSLLHLGASRVVSRCAERIGEELWSS